MEFLSPWVLGFLLGFRHALDADHVAAVATMGVENWKKSLALAVRWGVAHAGVFGLLLVLFVMTGWRPSQGMESLLELIVAGMLVYLGLTTLYKMKTERVHIHQHTHDGVEHVHFHSHKYGAGHGHAHRPFVFGMVQGLAGSAPVLAVASIALLNGIVFLSVFGAGLIVGISLVGLAIRVPLSLSKSDRTLSLVKSAAGVMSVLVGISMVF